MTKTESELLEEIFGTKVWDDMSKEERYDHIMKESRLLYEDRKDNDPYAFHKAVERVVKRFKESVEEPGESKELTYKKFWELF